MLTNEQLTTNLKVARTRLNLSQKETAKRLGVSLVTYRKYEASPYDIPFSRVYKLADILNVTLNELLEQKLLKAVTKK